ncbi:hypothetical protein [Glutamicibacter nicotianae]|uniref:hypothetical protein n=1 Tax=Glutamicibacter nicotianae TaxID=37929 RepID=UPI001958CB92|nr:hypothetical protein [Glutamicibacter nicotianae]MBM7768611.1 hypothetical protein [Glutamicibacter nicotianae]
MQIELDISGALHACCHPGFAVGEKVRWEFARLRYPDGTVVYELNDHDTFSESGVPVSPVHGIVADIHYIDHHYEPAIGDPGVLLPSGEPARITPTTSVPAGTDFNHDLIHVTLELLDPNQLPQICDWDPQLGCPSDPSAREDAARAQFELSSASVHLRELAEELAKRYGHFAQVRSDGLGQISMLPRAAGAAEVHWRLDFSDVPTQLAQIVEAVTAGRLEEQRQATGASMVLAMSIELADGTTLIQRDTVHGFGGQDAFAVIGPLGDRLARTGEFTPWA